MVVPYDSGIVTSTFVRVPSHSQGDPESDSMLLNLGNVSSLAARENVRSTLPTVLLGPKQKNPTLNATGGRMNSPTMVTATKRKLTSTSPSTSTSSSSSSSSSSPPLAKSRRINSGTNCYSPSTTTHTPTPAPQMKFTSSSPPLAPTKLEIKNLLPNGPLVPIETAHGQVLMPIQTANGQPLKIVYLDFENQTLITSDELIQQRNELKRQNMEFQNKLRLFTQLFNDKKRLCNVVVRRFPDIELSTKRI